MPASSRFLSASSPTLGMSRVISSWPSLVSRAITSNSSIWIEVKTSSDTMRSEIRIVLEVVAVPRHEGAEHVAAQGELAELGRRPVADHIAGLHMVADAHQRPLRDAGVLVRALELQEIVDVDAGRVGRGVFGRADDDAHAIDLVDDAGAASDDGNARIARHRLFH